MPQMARTSNGMKKPPAYWESIRSRIETAKAVDVLNKALTTDKPLPHQKVQVAMFLVNKLLPSMQAVAVQVEHKVASNWADIQAKALEAGIDPSTLLPAKSLNQQEKVINGETVSEGGLPPDTQS